MVRLIYTPSALGPAALGLRVYISGKLANHSCSWYNYVLNIYIYIYIYIYVYVYIFIYVTRHEKARLMYTKYTSSYYESYLLYCSTYQSSVNCTRYAMKYYINSNTFIRLLCLLMNLFKFEIQKFAQILCAHKPYFLMPDHIYVYIFIIE